MKTAKEPSIAFLRYFIEPRVRKNACPVIFFLYAVAVHLFLLILSNGISTAYQVVSSAAMRESE